jgi:long-chain fatty acid transport protein
MSTGEKSAEDTRVIAVSLIATATCLALAAPAGAGGLYISEFGTPSMGTASAGATAGVRDASTATHNIAGMTYLDDHQLMLGLAPGYATVNFHRASDSPTDGGSGGEQGGLVPILSASYVHKLSDRLRFGLGLLSISGASLDPDNDWTGRRELADITLFTLSVSPTLAFRVTDWLSIGAGAFITYGRLDWNLIAERPVPPNDEGKVKLDDADDVATAAVVGVMLEPLDDVRVGIKYQSKTDLELDGKAKLPAGFEANFDVKLPLAQFVELGIHWDVTERLALLLGADWEDWSEADAVPVSVANLSAKAPLGFKDTYMGSIGLEYRLTDTWLGQTGFRYDSSALDKKDRTTALPVDRQIRIGIGAIHDLSDKTQLGFAFEWANLGQSKVANARVKGDYDRNDIFFLSLNVNWKKLPWGGMVTF